MKKFLALILGLVMLLGCVSAVAEEAQVDPESMVYESKWVCGDVDMEIYQEEEGFRIMIIRTDDYPAGTCWQYSATYKAEDKSLVAVPTGTKNAITYTEDGTFEFGKTAYEDGEAVFSLNADGQLVWKDQKEDAGKDMLFRKIGNYDKTVWVCDRAKIEMYWEEEGYKVYVEWASTAEESRVWMYSCTYRADTDSLTGFGSCEDLVYDESGTLVSNTEVYSEGAVEFSLTEDHKLVWKDLKEDAGKGMLFELMDF